jgi:hypothetical protein
MQFSGLFGGKYPVSLGQPLDAPERQLDWAAPTLQFGSCSSEDIHNVRQRFALTVFLREPLHVRTFY